MEEIEDSPEYQNTKWDYINKKNLDYLIYKELKQWEDQEE